MKGLSSFSRVGTFALKRLVLTELLTQYWIRRAPKKGHTIKYLITQYWNRGLQARTGYCPNTQLRAVVMVCLSHRNVPMDGWDRPSGYHHRGIKDGLPNGIAMQGSPRCAHANFRFPTNQPQLTDGVRPIISHHWHECFLTQWLEKFFWKHRGFNPQQRARTSRKGYWPTIVRWQQSRWGEAHAPFAHMLLGLHEHCTRAPVLNSTGHNRNLSLWS